VTGTIVALGVIVTFYTALGGVHAVIWNDVAQFIVRFGGLTAVVVIASQSVPGGLTEIWQVASAAGKTTLVPPFATSSGGVLASVQAFFEQPLNVVSIMFALMVGRMAAYVGDQIMVQRLQTTKSLKDARQAFIVTAAGDIIWMFALSFVGLALFAYFQRHPLPADSRPTRSFRTSCRSPSRAGSWGLVIASIMASSLSSVDSAINSCTSVVVVDFYNRLVLGRQTSHRLSQSDERHQVLVARVATVGFGALGTLLAINVSRIGSLLEIANKTDQRIYGSALRHLPAGDVQPASDGGAGADCRPSPARSPATTWRIARRLGSCGRRRSAWRRRSSSGSH